MQNLLFVVCVVDTTIRVTKPTYKTIIKTRGAFEQTFAVKLTLDEAIYLAGSYINIVYEEFQTLLREDLIKIVIEKDGSYNVKWTRLDEIAKRILPRVLVAFQNFQDMLEQKGKMPLITVSGT